MTDTSAEKDAPSGIEDANARRRAKAAARKARSIAKALPATRKMKTKAEKQAAKNKKINARVRSRRHEAKKAGEKLQAQYPAVIELASSEFSRDTPAPGGNPPPGEPPATPPTSAPWDDMPSRMGPMTLGNSLWRLKTRHGRPPIFTPDELWDAACEFFEMCDEHPVVVCKELMTKAGPVQIREERPRAYTLEHLYLFLRINQVTFVGYEKKPEYSVVCSNVRYVIFQQKFVGAAAEVFNVNLIIRDLGLADRIKTGDTGETQAERLMRLRDMNL